MIKTRGQIAYDIFSEVRLENGVTVTLFEDLDRFERIAWETAAQHIAAMVMPAEAVENADRSKRAWQKKSGL